MIKKTLSAFLVVAVSSFALSAQLQSRTDTEKEGELSRALLPERPWESIDVAICLDTSGSMQGLIDAARLKLWEVVNDLSLVQPTPRLRVALLTFGSQKGSSKDGWVTVETDLTEDLDLVSDRLFELESAGGAEYVGRVLETAINKLSWTDSHEALKLIFVAGNEPADQDPQVNFREMAEEAYQRDILVNSIYCGVEDHVDTETWKEIAELARGQFATIDHRRKVVLMDTPFDEELTELGAAINETYIPLGEEGRARRDNQAKQDENAADLSSAAAASRAQAKSSPLYSSSWDLVDALAAEKVDLYELEESELPESLREMSLDQREIFVQDMTARREELRQRIAELGRQRRQYIAEQLEARGIDDSWAFDSALRRVIREKGEEKGFYFPDP
jgi:Mg-chelatase subunit ChlD